MAVNHIAFAVAFIFCIQYAAAIWEHDSANFFVDYTGGAGAQAAKYVVVFPNVVTNHGNVYDAKTGKFTAPDDGTYEFSFSAQSNKSQGYASLTKNGIDVAIVHVNADWIQGTRSAILDLKKGDQVWVSATGGLAIWASAETVFSGKLLPAKFLIA